MTYLKPLLAALALCMAVPAHGSDGADLASPKRIGPPEPGTTKFITVQIDPTMTAPTTPSPDVDAAEPGQGRAVDSRYAWFWDEVPAPRDAMTGPERFQTALGALGRAAGGARDVAAPRLDALRRISDRHGIEILTATIGTQVSPALALAVISVESSGRIDAVSSAGARGLMQLMPATADRFGVSDETTAENIRAGVAYLDWLLRHFEGDPVLALAGYNAGEGAVRDHAGVPPYPETRDYVPKVLSAWRVARTLCMTPPDLVTDGCVFQGRQAAVR